MLIRKITEGSGIPDNAVLDGYSTSQTDAYSCNYVNNLHTYSTTEKRIGTWIDGKPLYRKVIDFGYLPNNSTKAVNHNITNIQRCTNIKVIAQVGANQSASGFEVLSIENAGQQANTGFNCYINATNINIATNSNRTSHYAYVIIEYTKITD